MPVLSKTIGHFSKNWDFFSKCAQAWKLQANLNPTLSVLPEGSLD